MATRRATHRPFVGTAGWSVPRHVRDAFPADGSTLQRYAAVFGAVEINSSFYRPHATATYAKWAASVPKDFRFAVKVPQAISHERALVGCAKAFDAFLHETSGLGERLGCLLLQLPPSQRLRPAVARRFLSLVRRRWDGGFAIEPRHASWTTPDADALLVEHRVARVAADPARAVVDAEPGGWPGLRYWRLHGSPRVYYSAYDDRRLAAIAAAVRRARRAGADAWCILDNTASGAAAANALTLAGLLRRRAG